MSVLEEQTTVIQMLTVPTLRVASSVTVGMAMREMVVCAQVGDIRCAKTI